MEDRDIATGGAAPPASDATGRRAAAQRLMADHGKAVFGLCMRELHDRGLAEDVTQQVFLEAYRDLDRFQQRSSVRTWLFGIAYHRCLDAHKRRQRRLRRVASDESVVAASEDPGTGPHQRLEDAERRAALEACLAQLPLEVRATVLTRFQTGATYEELAREFAASADALQARVARALVALRRCMESKGWTGAGE